MHQSTIYQYLAIGNNIIHTASQKPQHGTLSNTTKSVLKIEHYSSDVIHCLARVMNIITNMTLHALNNFTRQKCNVYENDCVNMLLKITVET